MKDLRRIGVIGGGSWGTALVKVLQYHQHSVNWWVRREEQLTAIQQEGFNPDYLSYTQLKPDHLFISTSLKEIAHKSDILFLAVPSAFLPQVFDGVPPGMLSSHILISAVKGLEPISHQPVHSWLQNNLGVAPDHIGVIGGPCHSEEVAMQRLSFLTLGVFQVSLGEKIREILQTPYLRILISDDVQGISLAAVLKNIYGILAGTAYGLRYGDNYQAVLVSNALLEMEQVLSDMTGHTRNIQHSVYAGDLLVTSYSGFSRNWMLGNLIGKGYPVKAALLEIRMIAEGYYAANSILSMPGFNIGKYPLLQAASAMLYSGMTPDQVFRQLADKLR